LPEEITTPADVGALQPVGEGADLVDRLVGEDVHRPLRHVEDEMQDAVIRPRAEIPHRRRIRHRRVPPHFRNLAYYTLDMYSSLR
jgi:hypothetical protein